eukprot:UN24383
MLLKYLNIYNEREKYFQGTSEQHASQFPSYVLQMLHPLEKFSLHLLLSFTRCERLEILCISLNELLVDTAWFC